MLPYGLFTWKGNCYCSFLLKSSVPLLWQPKLIKTLTSRAIRKLTIKFVFNSVFPSLSHYNMTFTIKLARKGIVPILSRPNRFVLVFSKLIICRKQWRKNCLWPGMLISIALGVLQIWFQRFLEVWLVFGEKWKRKQVPNRTGSN